MVLENLSPITLIKLLLIFSTSSGFLFQFEACITYYFHTSFVFDFVLDALIVVFTPRVYLIDVKVNMCWFFFLNQLLFCS